MAEESLDLRKLKKAVGYIDSWIEPNFDNSRFPGLQVAIQQGNNLIYSGAFGYANVAKKEKMSTKHVFRIASHSKTFTATAIMQLREKGKLKLDDKVSQHVDWFRSARDKRIEHVTIGQLLNHTAGIIRDGENCDFWQLLREFPEKKELQTYVKDSRLIYDPDERFKYSNFGFSILGQVIEAVTGATYDEYVSKNIIEKLHLESTGSDLDDKSRKLLATGYSQERPNNNRKAFKHVSTNAFVSAAGFYGNAEDTAKYFSAHFYGNEKLLADGSKRTMQHGNWETDEEGEKYALGMANYVKQGWSLVGHGGGFPGFITRTLLDPKRKLAVVVLTNSWDGPAGFINNRIINILDAFQKAPSASPSRTRRLSRLTGRFYTNWGPTDILLAGNKIYATDVLGWTDLEHADELSIVDSDTLQIEKASGHGSAGETVKYTFSPGGDVKSINYAGYTLLPLKQARTRGWV